MRRCSARGERNSQLTNRSDVAIVFCLDNGNGNIGLVVQDVVSALRLSARHELSTNDNAPFGEGDFFADLQSPIPSALLNRRANELGTDVSLAEVSFVHRFC